MKILIVEDEPDIRELLTMACESKLKIRTISAGTGNEGIEKLKANSDIFGVISDYTMPDGTGGDLYKYVKSSGRNLPFVLCTSHQLHALPEFKNEKLAGFLPKPFPWDELVMAIRQAFTLAFPPASEESEHFPVRLTALTRINTLDADLYVKLADKKFVKLMEKGDSISHADLTKYAGRKIDCLYLKRKDCDTFLSKFTLEITTLSYAKNLQWNSSCDILESAHESIYETVRTFGFTQEAQDLAKASAQLAIRAVANLPDFSRLIINADPSQFLFKHSALLGQISCHLAYLIEWTAEPTQYKLALAATLHDLTISESICALFELSENGKKTTEIDKNEIQKFQKHPQESALLVSQLKEIPADVADIVLHHHEEPNGRGFPNGLMGAQLAPLSSLFIIAHRLVNLIWENKGPPSVKEYFKDQIDYFPNLKFARKILS